MRHGRYERARDHLDRAAGSRSDLQDILRQNTGASAIYSTAVRSIMPLLPFHMWEFRDDYAQLPDMQEWAEITMASREPDFTIGGDYMHRWFIIPRNDMMNVYLHRTMRSDNDVPHDHPWDNTSFVLSGGYTEHTPTGVFERKPGDVVQRKATDVHRLELWGTDSVSLFFTGPKVRDWGFHCPKGFVPWQQFTQGEHGGRGEIGGGCGEYA